MPWSPSSFRKHNKNLRGVSAAKAAEQANAILKKTGDEGLAIAVANRDAKKRRSSKEIAKTMYKKGKQQWAH